MTCLIYYIFFCKQTLSNLKTLATGEAHLSLKTFFIYFFKSFFSKKYFQNVFISQLQKKKISFSKSIFVAFHFI